MRGNEKKAERSFRMFVKVLATSGYSEEIAGTIWKWYNPPELNGNKPKKQ